MALTRRQKEILDFIESFLDTRGYSPSFEEIAGFFQYRSLATVHEHLSNLERKGYIRRAPNESRGVEITHTDATAHAVELPILGTVAAGEPIEAVLERETMSVPQELIPKSGPNYVLRVRGESMIDEHIDDGDFVVVNGRTQADNGEMVIALVNGQSATVKRLYREGGGWVRLQPSNQTMSPLRFHERDVMIQGIVVGVIRKY